MMNWRRGKAGRVRTNYSSKARDRRGRLEGMLCAVSSLAVVSFFLGGEKRVRGN